MPQGSSALLGSAKSADVGKVKTARAPRRRRARRAAKTAKKRVSGRKRAPRKVSRPTPMALLGGGPDCAKEWALALANPFDASPACMPTTDFSFPTWRVKASRRVVINAAEIGGTGGVFALILRVNAAGGDSSAATFQWTTAITSMSAAMTAHTWTTAAMSNLPFSSVSTTTQVRLAALGIRGMYAGNETSRGGTVAMWENGDEDDSALTINGILGKMNCRVETTMGNGRWQGVNWSGPTIQSEKDFKVVNTYVNGLYNPLYLMFLGQSTAAAHNLEICCHYEYAGSAVVQASATGARVGDFNSVVQTVSKLTATTGNLGESGNPDQSESSSKILEDIAKTGGRVLKAVAEGFVAGGGSAYRPSNNVRDFILTLS